MNKLPIARSADIVVQNLDKEILIYDLKSHKAFNLNETSALVYQACDGKTTFDDLKINYGFSDELIFLALDELKKENLIDAGDSLISPFAGMSRREAIKKVGIGSAIALPVVSFLVTPTAAQAQSGACTNSNTIQCECTVSQTAFNSGVRNCSDPGNCDRNCACQGTNFSPDGDGIVTVVGLCEAVSA